MSNSNRNPKEIKDLIEKCKVDHHHSSDLEILDESFRNLRNLSMEEKTEIGMMKSRIDEQSRLIMVLKQRSDEFIRKNIVLEKLNQDLIDQKMNLEHDLTDIQNSYKQINSRFETLSKYNEEIIKIKDEYKQANVKLKQENEELSKKIACLLNNEEFKKEKAQLEEIIKSLNEKIDTHETILIKLKYENENKLIMIKKEANDFKQEKLDEIYSLNYKLNESELKYSDFEKQFSKKQIENETKLNDISLQLKQSIKEKEEQAIKIKKLIDEKTINEQRFHELEKQVNSLNEKIRNDSILFNENVVIKKLKSELDESSKRYEDLQKDFGSYKVYMNTLIQKEKDLNAKLRYLVN